MSELYVKPGPEGPWPDSYLHVRDCKSGQEWFRVIPPHWKLDIERWVRIFIREEFCGELKLDGFQSQLEADYYAQIIIGGLPPTSAVVWTSGGFWLKGGYEG